ncbi:MAG: efflux RND transporter periplasmic adaptor subunit [bacterium]|nr:efflux RND transporter periplasmic adaptor subunit [bacterium]
MEKRERPFAKIFTPPPSVRVCFILGLTLGGHLLLLAGPRIADAQRQRTNRPISVNVQKAEEGQIGRRVTATGTLFAQSDVKLMAQAEGRVLEVLVREGDRVRKGQVLARFDDTLIRIELALAESERAAVRARRKKMEAGFLPEEIAAVVAEVSQARAALDRTRAEVAATRARLKEAESNAQSLESLYKRGVVSRLEWIKVTAELNRARAEVNERQARLAEDSARIRVVEERLKIKRIGSRPEDVEAARAEEQKAIHKVQFLRVRLGYFQIQSPISGVVAERNIEPGDLAVEKAHVLSLAHIRTLRLRARVSELDLPALRVGQEVVIQVDAYPDRHFRGKLTRLFPRVDPQSRQVMAEVELSNADYVLRPGLLARLTFEPVLGAVTIVLPVSAVEWDASGDQKKGFVYVLSPDPRGKVGKTPGRPRGAGVAQASEPPQPGGKSTGFIVRRRAVRFGGQASQKIQILEGLKTGEQVVISAISSLRDGQPVRVVGP